MMADVEELKEFARQSTGQRCRYESDETGCDNPTVLRKHGAFACSHATIEEMQKDCPHWEESEELIAFLEKRRKKDRIAERGGVSKR